MEWNIINSPRTPTFIICICSSDTKGFSVHSEFKSFEIKIKMKTLFLLCLISLSLLKGQYYIYTLLQLFQSKAQYRMKFFHIRWKTSHYWPLGSKVLEEYWGRITFRRKVNCTWSGHTLGADWKNEIYSLKILHNYTH